MPAWRIPVGQYVEKFIDYLLDNFEGGFDAFAYVVELISDALESALLGIPWWLLILLIGFLALYRVSWRFGLVTISCLLVVVGLNLWDETISTLALVISATILSLVIGVPLGIWMSRNDRVESIVRPILDFMQTMPAFVYLIPAAMFFGLGKVPGTIATIIFSMPPVVRLSNLGIRQVPKELVEAGQAFGCTQRQLLFKVQIPTALPSIMAGINQTIMLALSMVVIASMIGAGGLGNEVLKGIQQLDVGLGFEGGLGVVILAIILDRITQSFGERRQGSFMDQLKAAFKK